MTRMNYVQGSLRSLLKKVSDPAKLPALTRSANRESISYGDSYGAGGGAERFFNKPIGKHGEGVQALPQFLPPGLSRPSPSALPKPNGPTPRRS